MALELIKISEFPQVNTPEDWIVVTDATGIAHKISKEDFKEWLGTVTVISDKPISLSDPTPTVDGTYLPTDPGTYTNAGGLEYDPEGDDAGKYVQFIKNDTVWTKLSVDLPQAENKIEVWEAGTYTQGDQRIHNGQIWSVDVLSTTEEPGVGEEWIMETFSDLYNVSSNGQRFSLANAVSNIPVNIRREGLNISFIKEIGSWTHYRYVGEGLSGWTDIGNWQLVEDADEKILDYGLGKMGNSEEIVFDGNGDVSSVIYKNAQGAVIRTDTYQYGATQIIEEQSLLNGYKRTFLTDLNTLKTIRLDTSYKDLIQHPFSVINVSNGWQLTGGTSISGDKAILNSFPSTLRYRHNIEPFKSNTKYGLLLKAKNNTLSRSLTLLNGFTGNYDVIVSGGNNGYVKAVLDSRSDAVPPYIMFQLQSSEAGSITVSEIRMFELNDDSLVKFDFENLSANQLNSKYPKQ